MERVAEAVLTTPGEADQDLRRAVAAFAGGDKAQIPDELRPYVDKVARNAYKVTDGDVDRLREAGYSEDAIFELTLAAALGYRSSRRRARSWRRRRAIATSVCL